MTDLLGGQVDIMCDQTTNTTKQIQGGTIKAYAVTSPKRLDVLPDVPTTEEGGLADMEVGIWHGIYAPKGTPAEVTERLSKSLQLALKDPNVVARFAELGTLPVIGRRCHARCAEGQARKRDHALEADHRSGRPVRGLIHQTGGRKPPVSLSSDSRRTVQCLVAVPEPHTGRLPCEKLTFDTDERDLWRVLHSVRRDFRRLSPCRSNLAHGCASAPVDCHWCCRSFWLCLALSSSSLRCASKASRSASSPGAACFFISACADRLRPDRAAGLASCRRVFITAMIAVLRLFQDDPALCAWRCRSR